MQNGTCIALRGGNPGKFHPDMQKGSWMASRRRIKKRPATTCKRSHESRCGMGIQEGSTRTWKELSWIALRREEFREVPPGGAKTGLASRCEVEIPKSSPRTCKKGLRPRRGIENTENSTQVCRIRLALRRDMNNLGPDINFQGLGSTFGACNQLLGPWINFWGLQSNSGA